jgi:hypothetical protein
MKFEEFKYSTENNVEGSMPDYDILNIPGE